MTGRLAQFGFRMLVMAVTAFGAGNQALAQTAQGAVVGNPPSPVWPAVEIGAHGTFLMPEQENAHAFGGRVTFYQTSRRAFEVVGAHVSDRYRNSFWDPRISSRADLALGQFRQTLSSSLASGVFMTFGTGVVREVTHYPGFGNILKPHDSATNDLALVGGVGYQRTIADRLAVRADAQILAASFGLSPFISAGVSVPLTPYPAWTRRSELASAAPSGVPVRLGETVWVTTADGAELHGTVTRLSASGIAVGGKYNESNIDVSVIRRVETPDSIVNGVKRGAGIGGVSGAGLGLLVSLLCEDDVQCRVSIPLLFAGVGAGVGGAAGGIIDGLVDGRRVVYQSPAASIRTRAFSVSPLISRTGTGLRATLRW